MITLAQNRLVVALSAVGLGLVCGASVVRHPTYAALLAVVVVAFVGLAVLGERAYAWFVLVVVVAPWYPMVNDIAGPPRVPQRVLCAAIAASALLPWLWSLASDRTRRTAAIRTPSRRALLYGLVFVCLTGAVYETLGSFKGMIESGTFGLLWAGVTFLCARRFADVPRAWGPAALAAFVALLLLGLAAKAQDSGQRVGYFTGYPITYGALLVGLGPAALVEAARRSRLLAVGLGALGCLMLIFSESRSAWVAVFAMIAVLILLLLRQGQWRALRRVGTLAVVALAAIMFTGSLHGIVERKLSSSVAQSDSVTHRSWSYGYALGQIRDRPIFGAGAPGYSAAQAADATGIGAIDNGYLSITVDTGLFGLFAVLVPIAVALTLLARWLWWVVEPPLEDLALVLGVVGMSVVTIFYDSFYWAQIVMLLAALGGTLSARRSAAVPAGAQQRRGRRRQRRRASGPRRALGAPGPSL
jgi:O-antigen ligase